MKRDHSVRILHVIPTCNPDAGGTIEGVRQLALALKDMGVVVEVASMDPPDAPYIATQPFKVHAVGQGVGKLWKNPALRHWLIEHGSEYERIVVDGLWQYHGIAVWQTRHQHKRPYFVFCHGMMDSWFRRRFPLKHVKKQIAWWLYQGPILRDAEAVLFTSEAERMESKNGFWPYRLKERLVQYGTAGLPASVDSVDPFFEAYPELKGKRLLLFLGRIHVKKGCDLLIRSFAKVAGRDPNLDLVFAGPDNTNWRPELEAIGKELGVSERIHWLGMIGGDLKWQTFLAAEAFTLPSHQENFGVAVAEALSASLPVLISNKVNIWREIVADGAGFAEPDDQSGSDRLLENWESLTAQAKQKVRAATRPCFEANFEIGHAARKLIEVYGLEVS